jgi:hypothetical protein
LSWTDVNVQFRTWGVLGPMLVFLWTLEPWRSGSYGKVLWLSLCVHLQGKATAMYWHLHMGIILTSIDRR